MSAYRAFALTPYQVRTLGQIDRAVELFHGAEYLDAPESHRRALLHAVNTWLDALGPEDSQEFAFGWQLVTETAAARKARKERTR